VSLGLRRKPGVEVGIGSGGLVALCSRRDVEVGIGSGTSAPSVFLFLRSGVLSEEAAVEQLDGGLARVLCFRVFSDERDAGMPVLRIR